MRSVFSLTFLILLGITGDVADAQLIVAHRGASYDAPENTLAAFRLAWERRADAIEGDFYLTKDGEIVCIHDKTTKRVAPKHRELKVAESTLRELRTLDVGRWKHERYAGERIPTLKEVLATVLPGKQIFVEVKCGPEILPVLKRQLAASRLKPEQIVLICFDEAVVTQSRKLMPRYKANWLTSFKRSRSTRGWEPTRDQVLNTLTRTGASGLGARAELAVIDQAFVNAIHAVGKELHVWTVNDAESALVLHELGAASVTTDRPAFIRRSLLSPVPP